MGWTKKLKRLLPKKAAAEISSERNIRLPTVCHYKTCDRKLSMVNSFKCPDCEKYHCGKHKSPKAHKCIGKPVKLKELQKKNPPLITKYVKK